jgi:hypothetical protein
VLTPKAFEEKLEAMDPFLRGLFRILANTIRGLTTELASSKKEVDPPTS